MIFSVLQFFISLPTTSRATLIEKNQKQTKIMHKRLKVTPYWNCWRNLLKNCEDLLSSFLTDPFASQNKDLTKNFFRIFIYFFSNNKSQRIKTWFFFIVFHFTIFVATSQSCFNNYLFSNRSNCTYHTALVVQRPDVCRKELYIYREAKNHI